MSHRVIDLSELMKRGDAGYEELSEIEKDLYGLWVFYLTHQMEGFTHFFASHNNKLLPRVLDFLERVNAPNRPPVARLHDLIEREVRSWDADAVDAYVCGLDDEAFERLKKWSKTYESQTDDMWRCVDRFLREHHGMSIDERILAPST